MYYEPMMDGGDWAFGIFMMMFWLIIFAAIVIIAVRIQKSHYEGTNHGGPTPLDRAKMRYAQGEITKEQFEQLKKDLSK